jgi:hypothetical protein
MIFSRNIRPEIDLLLQCARTREDSVKSARITELLRQELDWDYLIAASVRHGVMPLLFWHLRTLPSNRVPVAVMDGLRKGFYRNAARNLILSNELCKILALFESRGISGLPFKGPVLASSVYQNFALRQSGDLDIFVPEEQVLRAKDVLLSHGFRPQFHLTEAQEAAYLRSWFEYNFTSQDTGIFVEIHWRLVPGYFPLALDMKQLWSRAGPTSMGRATVLTLAPEDLLLMLCIHGAKHCWARLGWICDISELIGTQSNIDWKSVLARAVCLGSERILFLGLFLASELLGAPFPSDLGQRVQAERAIHRLASQVCEVLFAGGNKSLGQLEKALFYLRARERISDRIRCSFRLAMAITQNTGDWQLLKLPRAFSFLYYPLRTIRLLAKYGVGPIRILLFSARQRRDVRDPR